VAVFDATGVRTKETRPLLNVAVAEILSFAQLTYLCTDFHWGRLHQLWWKLTIEFQPLDDPLHFRST
jgi:hypothetical protein